MKQFVKYWSLPCLPVIFDYVVESDRSLVAVVNLLAPELFFFILAQPVYKMLILQEPNTLELWNKLHFEEKKPRVYTMFKIFSTYIC